MNDQSHDTGSKAVEAFARNSARMAEAAAMFTAAMCSIVPPSEVLAAMAARSAAVYEQIRRDAERIGAETRRSISLAAMSAACVNPSALTEACLRTSAQVAEMFAALPSQSLIAGMSGPAIAGRAFARQTSRVTKHLEGTK